jgi:hypothetical protein
MSDVKELLKSWNSKDNIQKRELIDWLVLRHFETKKDKRDGFKITFWLSDADYEYLHTISPSFKNMCH